MYGGDFSHINLSRVVEVNGQVTIAMITDLDESLRSCEKQDLRDRISSSSVKVNLVPGHQLFSKSALTKRT